MSNIQKAATPQLTMKEVTEQLNAASTVKAAVTLPFVETRFIRNYEAVTGRKDGKQRFEDEVHAYLEILEEKPDLKKVDKFFHFSALVKAGRTGLSFKDNKLYLIPTGGGLKVQSSPAGKREQFEMMPEVKRVPEPILVMKGDKFLIDKLNGIVKVHEETEKTERKIVLENIFASYTRIYWKNGTITDTIVYHDDLVRAKSKSKAQSEAGFWNQWPGEAAKKVSINRAFRLYHKYPDGVEILGKDDDSDDVTTTDVDHTDMSVDTTIITTSSGEQVDQTSGEVIEPTLDITNDQETSAKKDKKNKRDNPATLSEEEKFT